ncbi:AEC family transporter [Glaciecola sp. SC05]|uniref:AEC family transporter n=1 Tax=Glaciecola sp. SC05 TaxID=1987355 RepID=UPI00352841F1
MSHFIIALVPVLVLIFIGYGLKRINFISKDVWSGIEKLTYYVMFPALLIQNIGRQNIHGTPWQDMFLIVFIVLVLATAALLLLYKVQPTMTAKTFTSVFQGGIRFNTYIAFSISAAFYGKEGLGLAAISAGFMIVLVNFLCVGVFVFFGSNAASSGKAFIKQILLNPLIIGCVVGWSLSLSGIGLPGVSADILEVLGRAALPIGLMAVGAALKPRLVVGHSKAIINASIMQFLLKPALVIALCSILGLSTIVTGVLLIAFISPTASSAYILARQLGGDEEAMASIITLQTILAFVVMPLWAFAFLV